MKRKINAGTTSFIDRVFVRDTSQTTSVKGLTGLTSGSAGLTLYYFRAGAGASAAVSLASGTLGTWSSGGFKEMDATNMPGWYEVGIPNAAVAAGAASVGLHLRGATNTEDIAWQYELDAVNYQDGVHFGLTCLPNTAVTTNASLLTSGTGTDQVTVSGGRVQVQVGTAAGQINASSGKVPATLSATDVTGNVACDLQTVKTQAVTCSAGVTVSPYVGNTGNTLAVGSGGNVKLTSDALANTVAPSWYTAPTNLSAATIAAAVLNDTTDTTTAGSLGYLIGHAPSWYAAPTTPPTAAAIATAVWTDTTAGDFVTASSPGKVLVSQLGGAFTTTSSSALTTASLANAPTGGSAPTAAQVAAAVWQDATAGDFATPSSIGKLLYNLQVDGSGYAKVSSGTGTGQISLSSGAVTVGSNADKLGYSLAIPPPTASAIATAVLTDTTDTTTSGSLGYLVGHAPSWYTAPTNSDPWTTLLPGSYSVGTAGNIVGTNLNASVSSRLATSSYVASPTPGQVATAVWSDATAADFTVAGTPGRIVAQLGGSFLNPNTSVFTASALANAPAGSSSLSAAQIASAVWSDTSPTDFTTIGSPGRALMGGVTLSPSGLDGVVTETGYNARQSLALILDALLAKLGGVTASGPGVITIRDVNDTTTRATVSVDGAGNRTMTTLNPPH